MRTSPVGISSEGFTLLEMIVVIFILCLVLAVSFPSLTPQKDGKMKHDAGRIASILRYLYDDSVSAKETHDLRVNFREHTLRYRGPEGERAERIDNLTGMTLQSRGTIVYGEVTVSFDPTGAGETFAIHLTGVASSLDVVFNGLSGRVKVLSREGNSNTEGVHAS